MKLAISGKGGVGKTTIAAALVKLFAGSGRRVYAIDADPDVCLAAAIGIPDDEAAEIKPVVEMKELVNTRTGGEGSFFSLNPRVDDVPDNCCLKFNNISYLRMGGIKKGGSSCYCRENSFLHALVSTLLLGKDDVVVMDMSAGIEHLSRGTARGIDMMLVVVEPGLNSINTARLVMKMAGELGIGKVRIIGNKIRSGREKEFIMKNFQAHEVLGFVDFNESVWESAMDRNAAAESEKVLLEGLRPVYNQILREAGEADKI